MAFWFVVLLVVVGGTWYEATNPKGSKAARVCSLVVGLMLMGGVIYLMVYSAPHYQRVASVEAELRRSGQWHGLNDHDLVLTQAGEVWQVYQYETTLAKRKVTCLLSSGRVPQGAELGKELLVIKNQTPEWRKLWMYLTTKYAP